MSPYTYTLATYTTSLCEIPESENVVKRSRGFSNVVVIGHHCCIPKRLDLTWVGSRTFLSEGERSSTSLQSLLMDIPGLKLIIIEYVPRISYAFAFVKGVSASAQSIQDIHCSHNTFINLLVSFYHIGHTLIRLDQIDNV